MTQEKKQFKFSVIIPIYNARKYLHEAIDSVIGQTMDFEENIQMILVNDGSRDESESICLHYRDKYPDNILYCAQENQGVSAARNNGLQLAQGQYINFLDADDKWSDTAFQEAFSFLEEHPDINLVTCKQVFFEGLEGLHRLSRGDKFAQDGVIDIREQYQYLQMYVTPCFFRRDAIQEMAFDVTLKYTEDSLFTNQLILRELRYGVLKEPEFRYRKHLDGESAVQKLETDPAFYRDSLSKCVVALCRQYMDKTAPQYRYMQNYLRYLLRNYSKKAASHVLSDTELAAYNSTMLALAQQLDDTVLFQGAMLSIHEKLALASMKYQRDVKEEILCYKGKLIWQNRAIYSLCERRYLKVNQAEVRRRDIRLTLEISNLFTQWMTIELLDNLGHTYALKWTVLPDSEQMFFEDTMSTRQVSQISVPVRGVKYVFFRGTYNDGSGFLIMPDCVGVTRLVQADHLLLMQEEFI